MTKEMEAIFWRQGFPSMGDSYGDLRGTWQAWERRQMHRDFSWENLKEIDRWKTLCVGGNNAGSVFIVVRSTAALSLSHRKPVSTETDCDTHGV